MSTPPYVYALLAHGVIGGLDVLLNHEWLSTLPARRACAPEERLHSAREFLFAALFASLAWFEWQGALAWWIVALFAAELLVSARDVVIEGEIRALPASERFLHLLLFINLGIVYTLTGTTLLDWGALPTGLVAVHHGWASWLLGAMALGALGWALRDGLAARRLARNGAAA